jgi:hypothetical protein
MTRTADDHGIDKKVDVTKTSRRRLLVNLMGAGASPLLSKDAEARTAHRRYGRLYDQAAQMQNFQLAVNAFNNMYAEYNLWQSGGAQATTLYRYLDPTSNFNAWKVSDPQGSKPITSSIDFINFMYMIVTLINNQSLPNFNPTYGGSNPVFSTNHVSSGGTKNPARWTDSDQTVDSLKYDFKFNPDNNLLSQLHSNALS